MSISVLLAGHQPWCLGPGGLERQVRATARALEGAGVRVVDPDSDTEVDILHLFGAEPGPWQALRSWQKVPRQRLVLSPVLVEPATFLWRLAPARKLGISTTKSMKRDLVQAADVVVCLTSAEAERVQRAYGCSAAKLVTVPNGIDADWPNLRSTTRSYELPQQYVLSVGTVGDRKRQVACASALQGSPPIVCAGPTETRTATSHDYDRAVSRGWLIPLGMITDRQELKGVFAGAQALLQFSSAEAQSLVVLEAISMGLPSVLSDLKWHRELAAEYADLVTVCRGYSDMVSAVRVRSGLQVQRHVDTWDDVAMKLASVYERVLK